MGREGESGRFRVYVDDNYHFMDESERYIAGEFDDVAQAVARCRDIVDECLASAYKPGMSAAELLSGYKMFGEDPWVSAPPGRECRFRAWAYAEQRCAELCKAPEPKERPMTTTERPVPLLTARFADALSYAYALHSDQERKGSGVPYLAHLIGTASIALEYGADEDEAIAALLHDAVEDRGGAPRLAEIRGRFGDRVANIVQGCTDSEQISKPPWRERKEAYVRHLAQASASVLLVSASDKLHNARSILTDFRQIGDALWPRFTGGREGTLWYYRALVEAFRPRGAQPLVDELERAVGEIERLAQASRAEPG